MAKLRVDFSEVEQFENLTVGYHPIVVAKIDVRKAEGKPYPYLNWDMVVTEGPDEDRHCFMRTSVSPKALFRLTPVLQAFGVIEEDLEDEELQEIRFDFEYDEETGIVTDPDLEGEAAIVLIVDEEYEGSTRSAVSEVFSINRYDELFGQKTTFKKAKPVKAPEPEPEEDSEEAVAEGTDEEEEAPASRRHATARTLKPGDKKQRVKFK